LKNAPLFTKSPFLAMDLVQTEIRSGNVQLDKIYSLYLIEWVVQNPVFVNYLVFPLLSDLNHREAYVKIWRLSQRQSFYGVSNQNYVSEFGHCIEIWYL